MIQLKRIIQLKSAGLSKLSISQNPGLHRKTLNDYLFKLESTGESYQELLEQSESELAALVFNTNNTRVPDARLNDLKSRFDYFTKQLTLPGVTRGNFQSPHAAARLHCVICILTSNLTINNKKQARAIQGFTPSETLTLCGLGLLILAKRKFNNYLYS